MGPVALLSQGASGVRPGTLAGRGAPARRPLIPPSLRRRPGLERQPGGVGRCEVQWKGIGVERPDISPFARPPAWGLHLPPSRSKRGGTCWQGGGSSRGLLGATPIALCLPPHPRIPQATGRSPDARPTPVRAPAGAPSGHPAPAAPVNGAGGGAGEGCVRSSPPAAPMRPPTALASAGEAVLTFLRQRRAPVSPQAIILTSPPPPRPIG